MHVNQNIFGVGRMISDQAFYNATEVRFHRDGHVLCIRWCKAPGNSG
jgi:hypothetical protein